MGTPVELGGYLVLKAAEIHQPTVDSALAAGFGT
jgi:hypothetical protein